MRAPIATALFALVGAINLLPAQVLFNIERTSALYGVTVSGADMVLLMRHRAVLLGAIGALLIVAAWRPAWRAPALMAALASKAAFIGLYLTLDGNALIARVALVDMICAPLLVLAWWLGREANVAR